MKSLIVLIILISNSVLAADKIDRSEINQTLNNINSIPLKHNNATGVWFSKKDSDILLQLISKRLKSAFDTIDNQSIQIEALESAVNSYKESNKSYLELSELNRKMFDVAIKHIPDLNPPEPPWYKNSKATYIYGVITGGVAIFGSTYLATRALENK